MSSRFMTPPLAASARSQATGRRQDRLDRGPSRWVYQRAGKEEGIASKDRRWPAEGGEGVLLVEPAQGCKSGGGGRH